MHKALADARYKTVVDGLAASLDGRVVPVDVDWSIVDTPQFKNYLPENKSLVVENLRAGFPEAVVTNGFVFRPLSIVCGFSKPYVLSCILGLFSPTSIR